MKTYKCANCNKECNWRYQGSNKFCSQICSAKYKTKIAQEEFWAGNKPNIFRDVARRFIAERRGYKCEICGIKEWNGKDLTCELHHNDGNRGNNRLENLTIVCPNCHSQTPNHSKKKNASLAELEYAQHLGCCFCRFESYRGYKIS